MSLFIIIGLIIFIIFQSKKIKEQKKANEKDEYTLAMERYQDSITPKKDFSETELPKAKEKKKSGKLFKVIYTLCLMFVVFGVIGSLGSGGKIDKEELEADVKEIKTAYIERTKTESYQVIKESTGKYPYEDSQDVFLCMQLMTNKYGYTDEACKQLGLKQDDIDDAKSKTPKYAK